jgi:hypothetical protein
MLKLLKMIYKFQSQSVFANPVEIAEKKLQAHKEKGPKSPLSIFEVAHLMDTLIFGKSDKQNNSGSNFEICFN